MTLILSKPGNDFIEMLLHHIVTLFLILGSFMCNYLRIGSVVAFTHDISDIFAYLVRLTIDFKNQLIPMTVGISLLTSWAYSRL